MSELNAFVLGIVITAIPGPVLFEAIRRMLTKHAGLYDFIFGNFAGVSLLAAIAMTGVTSMASSPILNTYFFVAYGLVLVAIGAGAIRSQPKTKQPATKRPSTSRLQSLATGFGLATLNPMAIIFWATFLGASQNTKPLVSLVMRSISVELGSIVVFAALIGIIRIMHTRIQNQALLFISRTLGIILVGYGLTMFYKAIQ